MRLELRKKTKHPKEIEGAVRKQLAPLFADYHTTSSKFKLDEDPLFNPTFREKAVKAFKFLKLQSELEDF